VKRFSAAALVLLSLALPAFSQDKKPEDTKPIDFMWGVKIPMRDGVRLNATVYKPKDMKEPLPVIFTLTPYIADTYHERAYYFAQNGYVFALVDVRGRGNSQGIFEPLVHDGRDGHDIVEWLARQPWSNGKVTMWGGSYAGFDQWSTVKEFPPHLATVVPVASAHPGVDFPFENNIFYPYEMQWGTYTSGVTPQGNLRRESSFWIQKYRELYLTHRPFREFDKMVGNTPAFFQTWLEHPVPDAFYDAMVPAADDYKRVSIPILSITGHYDGDQRGAMEFYRRHMKYGTAQAKENHFLIIGPWDHAGTRTPSRDVYGLRFGEASMLDMNKLHKEWYDWTLKGAKKPEFLKNRVAYYVVGPGAEQWKYADSLESIAAERRTVYLHSSGAANDAFQSGRMTVERPARETPDSYTYDPLDTRFGEQEATSGGPFTLDHPITDQTLALNTFGNGLLYHTQPFAEEAEISGYVKFAAWIGMDVPDTDFMVVLYEIQPNGTSILLTTDQMRARYRESLRKEKRAKPGEIYRYEFDKFTWFSRRVMKGSRLRLLVTCPNTIFMQKNYNSGGVVADETTKDARTAHVTLYHGAEHPSYLEIPLVK